MTTPYNEKIEERMKAAYERKANEKLAQTPIVKEENKKTNNVKKSSPKVG